ncbi:hypothetical protein Scep_016635 [Stephania cephalantha]|uniref:Uncharacterized protein n=1 Tax=Stephania cephalantha TaxID=152367 RepID=A0AAP0IN68_9MAGN
MLLASKVEGISSASMMEGSFYWDSSEAIVGGGAFCRGGGCVKDMGPGSMGTHTTSSTRLLFCPTSITYIRRVELDFSVVRLEASPREVDL